LEEMPQANVAELESEIRRTACIIFGVQGRGINNMNHLRWSQKPEVGRSNRPARHFLSCRVKRHFQSSADLRVRSQI
jgi:hypothetical protein